MKKEIVLKLLKSQNVDDVKLGYEYCEILTEIEFKSILEHTVKSGVADEKYTYQFTSTIDTNILRYYVDKGSYRLLIEDTHVYWIDATCEQLESWSWKKKQ